MHRLCFYLLITGSSGSVFWVYLPFNNTKTPEEDYAKDAPAPVNSIAGKPYNFMGGDKVRTKRHVRISEPAVYLPFHPQYWLQFRYEGDISDYTFPTSNCLHLAPYKPWKSAKIVRLYILCFPSRCANKSNNRLILPSNTVIFIIVLPYIRVGHYNPLYNDMFRPLYLAIIRFVRELRQWLRNLRNRC